MEYSRPLTCTVRPVPGGRLATVATETNSGMAGRFLFPRHVPRWRPSFDRWWFRLGNLQFRIPAARPVRPGGRPGRRHVFTPARDPRLQSMMLGRLFVAGLHVKKGQVRVNQLLFWAESLRPMTLANRRGVIAFS